MVENACLGKTSCTIPATNTFFGGDPCFDTAKSLAVMAAGCSPVSATKVVVDFGENLSGWLKLRVKGTAGTQVLIFRFSSRLFGSHPHPHPTPLLPKWLQIKDPF